MLKGVRVIELAYTLPGPFSGMLLADMGAEVIKIETPGEGDSIRETVPGMFEIVNRNKKSVTLDLKRKEGVNALHRLAESADVFIDGFRPGVAKRLGADYETLKKLNRSIVYGSVNGYGSKGTWKSVPGHENNYAALAGNMKIPGEKHIPPSHPGIPIGDMAGGLFLANAVLGGLYERERTGKGNFFEVAMTECLLFATALRCGEFLLRGEKVDIDKMAHLTPGMETYPCKDGKEIAIGAMEDKFWRSLLPCLGLNDLADDDRYKKNNQRVENYDVLAKQLKQAFQEKDRAEWLDILLKNGVPCSPVYMPEEALTSSYVRERDMVQKNGDTVNLSMPVVLEDNTRFVIRNRAPRLGEHTREILENVLSPEELNQLVN